MPNTIEVTMTRRGFEVKAGGRTMAFSTMSDAFDFAQQRLQHAWQLRALKDRCE